MVSKVSYRCDDNAGALESMQQSSADAARILQDSGATACTDVTGFGLLGHLVEMTRPSQVCIPIHSSPATSFPAAAAAAAEWAGGQADACLRGWVDMIGE